jgi:hypothetical protein
VCASTPTRPSCRTRWLRERRTALPLTGNGRQGLAADAGTLASQMPQFDAYGNAVTTSSAAAARLYDRAVDAHLHAWPGVLEAAEAATTEDPGFALPQTLAALVLQGRGQSEPARRALAGAQAAVVSATPREQACVALISAILAGRGSDALALVITHAQQHPTDLLSVSTALGAYGLFAFSGRADHDAARLAFTDAVARHLPEDLPWMLAQRGWARIEAGQVDDGLALARRAIALRPQNGHNAHVILHGLFESNAHRETLVFLDGWLPGYPPDALMWGHLQWHAALAELALDDTDAALARLLGPICAYLQRGTPYMGLPDLVSLLWRLGLRGCSGLPWPLAQQHARQHFPQGSNVFGELHLALLAGAQGDGDAMAAVDHRLQARQDQGHAGATVARQVVQALRAAGAGDGEGAAQALEAALRDAVRLGGSHAQRSVLTETAQAVGDPTRPAPWPWGMAAR